MGKKGQKKDYFWNIRFDEAQNNEAEKWRVHLKKSKTQLIIDGMKFYFSYLNGEMQNEFAKELSLLKEKVKNIEFEKSAKKFAKLLAQVEIGRQYPKEITEDGLKFLEESMLPSFEKQKQIAESREKSDEIEILGKYITGIKDTLKKARKK